MTQKQKKARDKKARRFKRMMWSFLPFLKKAEQASKYSRLDQSPDEYGKKN